MLTYTVRNNEGDTQQVDEKDIKLAEADGYYPVVSKNGDEQRVSFNDLNKAFEDGYVAITQGNAIDDLKDFGRGALQGITGGWSDELAGLVGSGLDKLQAVAHNISPKNFEMSPDQVTEELKRTGFNDTSKNTYESLRDVERQANIEARERSPYLYGGGELAGGIATTAIPGLGTVKGATALSRIGQTALQGAAIGGVSGAGYSEEEDQTLNDAIMGASIGGVVGGLGGVIASLPKNSRLIDDMVGKYGVEDKDAFLKYLKLAGSETDEKSRELSREYFKKALPYYNLENIKDIDLAKNYISNDIAKNYGRDLQNLFPEELASKPGTWLNDTAAEIRYKSVGGKEPLTSKTAEEIRGISDIVKKERGVLQTNKSFYNDILEKKKIEGEKIKSHPLSADKEIQNLVSEMEPKVAKYVKPREVTKDITNRMVKDISDNIGLVSDAPLYRTSKKFYKDFLDSIKQIGKEEQQNLNLFERLQSLKTKIGDIANFDNVNPSEKQIAARKVYAELNQQLKDSFPEEYSKSLNKYSNIVNLEENLYKDIKKSNPVTTSLIGGGVGALAGGIPGAVAGAVFGSPVATATSKVGQYVYERVVPRALELTSDVIESTPKISSKIMEEFKPILDAAAKRGPKSLAATDYLLQQKYPTYRKAKEEEAKGK